MASLLRHASHRRAVSRQGLPAVREGRPSIRFQHLAWGASAIGFYIAATFFFSQSFPVRILYNGEAPPLPYNWVVPPQFLAASNIAPSTGAGSVPVGLKPGSVATGDGQAVVIFPEGAIESPASEASADVKITPLDPMTVPSAPQGLRFDGNAYRIEAQYTSSKAPIVLRRPATVVLRYPIHATTLLLLTDSEWSTLKSDSVPTTMQVFASTEKVGAFVAAAPAAARPAGLPLMVWWAYTTSGVGLMLVVVGKVLARRRALP